MASLATLAAVQPAAVKGLAGSSISGTKLHVKPACQCFRPKSVGSCAVVAKYGDKSVYFDLEDLGNTTGQWGLYGSDAPSPYNPLQRKFFETFAAPFTKRGLLLKFLILGGGSPLAYLSATASGDMLPIKKGPQPHQSWAYVARSKRLLALIRPPPLTRMYLPFVSKCCD